MQIEIHAHDFLLTEGLRAHVERRFQFAMSRFQNYVLRVSVRLSDINGPRGGVDKRIAKSCFACAACPRLSSRTRKPICMSPLTARRNAPAGLRCATLPGSGDRCLARRGRNPFPTC